MIRYPTLVEVLDLPDQIIQQLQGAMDIRHLGSLESSRPPSHIVKFCEFFWE